MGKWPRSIVAGCSLALLMVAAASETPPRRPGGTLAQPGTALSKADSCTADSFEPDNDASSAKPLGLGESQRRTLCDEDWIGVSTRGVVAFETRDLTGGAETVLDRLGYATYGGSGWKLLQTDITGGEAGSRIVSDPDYMNQVGDGERLRVTQKGIAYGGEEGYTVQSSCLSGCAGLGGVLFVPSVTHAPGANGTFFRSDLRLLNSSASPLSVTLLFTPSNTDGRTSRVTRNVTVPPEGVLEEKDILLSLFGLGDDPGAFGSLEIRPRGGNVAAAARTYNERADGSYGVYTPALPLEAAAGVGRLFVRELFLTSLLKSDGFRTNLGICEVTGGRAVVRGTLYDLSGRVLASRSWELPPWGHTQVNDVIGTLGAPSGEEAWMSLEVIDGSGWVLGYATVIDNGTSDAIFVPAQPATPWKGLAIPAAASSPGAFGAYYRTDLRLLNADKAAAAFTVTFRPAIGSVTPGITSKSFDVPARSVLPLDDVVKLFGGSAGAIEVNPVGSGGAVVTARTYTGEPGTSYGDTSSGVPIWGPYGPLSALILPPGEDSYRVNAGVLNENINPSRFSFYLVGEDGTSLGGASVVVPTNGQFQLNDALALPGRRPGNVARIEIEAEDAQYHFQASFLAYLVVIDNRSNDFVYVPAVPSPRPSVSSTIALPGDVSLGLTIVRRGVFTQGSPESEGGRDSDELPHEVFLTRDTYFGLTEVTRGQWDSLMHSGLSQPSLPVAGVSWNSVAGPGGFLEKLNAHLAATGQTSFGTFRLPTEAEWERATRAGTSGAFSFSGYPEAPCDLGCGPCPAGAENMVWCGDSVGGPATAMDRKPNAFGLFDVHGNVWEWVADWYGGYPTDFVTDPIGSATGTQRVVRGGGWNSEARLCRSANRFGYAPSESYDYVGFRMVASRP